MGFAASDAPETYVISASMPPAKAILEVRDLKTSVATAEGPLVVVDGVSFSLGAGETLCIVGESGSDLPPDNFSLCNQWLMLIFCPTFRIGWTSLFVLCSAIWQRRSWSSPSGWPRRCMSLPPSGSHAPNKT